MKSKEIPKEEIIKKEYLPFIIIEKKITGSNNSWSSIIEVKVEDPNGQIDGAYFTIQETISGCGLCIIKGITEVYIETKEKQEAFKRCLEQLLQGSNVRSSTAQKGCVIATLGEIFVPVHEQRLLGAGFKKIHTYDNIAHSNDRSNRYQSIYLLDIIRK